MPKQRFDELKTLAQQSGSQVTERCYSLLTIKSIDEDQRIIEGIASTPTPDRMGDIVEPEGAQFKLPVPLLWQHNSREPVGWVERVKISPDGIAVTCRFAKIAEESDLKNRLDDYWLTVKSKLVRGLSIGFKPIESSQLEDTWSYRFIKWMWLELSCVTIPANEEATITALKSIDQRLRAASGESLRRVVRLGATTPGDSGSTRSTPTSRGPAMPRPIRDQIADFEAKRVADVARMTDLMAKAEAEGRSLNAQEAEQYDNIDAEVKATDAHLVRLKAHEKLVASTATPAAGADPGEGAAARIPGAQRASSTITHARSNLAPGVRMARFAQALIRGKGNPQQALAIIENEPAWKSTPEIAMVMKAAIAAGDTTTAGWASELVYAENLANEFIEFLRPMTILGKIPSFRRVPFNIRVGGMSTGLTGYWVGQGQPIPASKAGTTSVSLAIAKAAGLCAIDNELARLSTPSAELMVRDDLAAAIVQLLDDSFINPNNGGVTNVSPASVTYGVTPVTPTGATYAAMRLDIQTMMETVLDANLDVTGSVWIMSGTLALKLSMMVNALDQKVNPDLSPQGGRFLGYDAVVSQAAQIAGSPQYNDILIWLHPREVFLADDGQVAIEASKEAAIQLLDNPTNASVGGTTPTTMISMFQTESMAIKAVRYINWVKRRSIAAQWIQAAAYT